MAEMLNNIVKEEYKDKVITITAFRKKYAEGVSSQAINYAIGNDLIDYLDIGPRVRLIVLTNKTLAYTPNSSPKRGTHRELLQTGK